MIIMGFLCPLHDLCGYANEQVAEDCNDTKVLLRKLSQCTSSTEILEVLVKIQGPFSLIYWQVREEKLAYYTPPS